MKTFERLRELRTSGNISEAQVSAVLFDFDGTLSNSLELGYEIMGTICEIHGYKALPQEEYRTLGTREVIKKMGIPLWGLPKLMKEGRKLMAERICEAQPVADIEETLSRLSERGVLLGIVTSNSEENVRRWLGHYGLTQYFQIVLGGGRLLRKERCIKKCLKNMRVSREQVLYIGDESRDIAACQRLKIRSVAVTWGLDYKEKLAKEHPYTVIDHPSQLLELLRLLDTSAA